MGRRAKKAPVQTKKRPTLSKRFKCPFCANEGTVECKMDFRNGIGSLSCRLCGASYQMPIHHLHEPVDVFSEWLDDCEAAAQGKTNNNSQSLHGGGGPGDDPPRYDESDDDDQQAIPESSGLGNRNNNENSNVSNNNSSSSKKAGKKSKASVLDDDDDDDEGGGKLGGNASSKPNYEQLGLEDSDDSDDE